MISACQSKGERGASCCKMEGHCTQCARIRRWQKHQGIFLVIQEQSEGSLQQFVQVASHTEKAKIIGLKPDSFYKLKVNS